ncbi:MAG: site-2 protease family protein [Planctomycetota bacterium]
MLRTILNFTFPFGRGIGGIPVKVSWLMIPFYFIIYSRISKYVSYLPALQAALLLAVIYGSVYLHEIGHALAIRAFRRPVSVILLWPLGGICISPSLPRGPIDELLTTLAGPMVNLILLVPSFALSLLFGGSTNGLLSLGGFFTFVFWTNLIQASFNLLLPMFPMDGGRILRAGLARKMPAVKATLIAVNIGMALAVVIGVLWLLPTGLKTYFNEVLLLIALMAFMSSIQEKRRVSMMPVYDPGSVFRVRYDDGGSDDVWRSDATVRPGFFSRTYSKIKRSVSTFFDSRRRAKLEREAQSKSERQVEVERILEKISNVGIGELTAEEKTTLNRASEELRKR